MGGILPRSAADAARVISAGSWLTLRVATSGSTARALGAVTAGSVETLKVYSVLSGRSVSALFAPWVSITFVSTHDGGDDRAPFVLAQVFHSKQAQNHHLTPHSSRVHLSSSASFFEAVTSEQHNVSFEISTFVPLKASVRVCVAVCWWLHHLLYRTARRYNPLQYSMYSSWSPDHDP